MSPAPKKRSTILVLVGAVVFVLGTGLAAMATRSDDGGNADVAAAAVTTTTIGPGTVAPPVPTPLTGFIIPAGHQAIALDVPFAPGIAGYAKAGDHVNIYGIFRNAPANASLPNPVAKLVLSDIEVLAVTNSPSNSTYVLSVDASQAEQIVYLAGFEASYLTLARDKQGQLTTIGRTPKNEV